MTIPCKKVLNGLRKLSSGTEDVFGFLGNSFCICLISDLSKTYDYTKYKGEINSVIRQLVSDGYLTYTSDEYSFALTQHGLHPYQFQWESFKSFLIRSIIVPIVVSLATTLLTLSIRWLLAML